MNPRNENREHKSGTDNAVEADNGDGDASSDAGGGSETGSGLGEAPTSDVDVGEGGPDAGEDSLRTQ